jgi:hypothetical protein
MQAIDVDASCICHGDVADGTPLFQCEVQCIVTAWDNLVPIYLAEWFVGKGAKLNYLHPKRKSMPVHLLTEAILQMCIRALKGYSFQARNYLKLVEHELFIQQIITSAEKDACTCACSQGGCQVGSVVAATIQKGLRQDYVPGEWRSQVAVIVDVVKVLLHFDPDVETHPAAYRALFRALTFDQLGLTHTCHAYNMDGIEDCDVFDIQDLEKDDIALLDKLQEEFVNAWEDSDGTLMEFLEGYWAERIEVIVTERNTPSSDQLERIRDLGVNLEPLGPEVQSKKIAKLIPKYGTWEWFQEVVRIIEEGKCNETELEEIIWGGY